MPSKFLSTYTEPGSLHQTAPLSAENSRGPTMPDDGRELDQNHKSIAMLVRRICEELDKRDMSKVPSEKLLTMLVQIKKEFGWAISANRKNASPPDPFAELGELERWQPWNLDSKL